MPLILSDSAIPHRPPLLTVICAALLTTAAAWLSQGTLAFTHAGGGRIALVPLSATAIALAVGAGVAVTILARTGAPLVPVSLVVLLFLPWLPVEVPAAFLIWTGPMTLIVWAAVLGGMGASLSPGSLRSVRILTLARKPQAGAAALALAIFSLAAWQVAPSVPGGDEPHYLVITQSLLHDGDLRIENNHRRGDYRAYFAGELPPHFIRHGRDGEIYSIHAPGLPVLIAPAFALAGYHGTVVLLVVLAALASALAWHLAWLVTGRTDAAWFGWATVTLSATCIFHTFTVYPDGPGAALVLTGIWGLLRTDRERVTGATGVRPWLLHGAALAALPWLHTRFAILAGSLGALMLWRLARTPNAAGKAVAFLAVPAASALLWIGFFVAIYGTPDPTAPYGRSEVGSVSFILGGLGGLLFDQRFGLIAYAPALLFAAAGLVGMLRRREHRRLAIEILFVTIPYLLAVTHFAMWWGGRSAPARFFAPVLLPMALPAAYFWAAHRGRTPRAAAAAALGVTIFASAVLIFVDGGRLAFNVRDAPALWLEWLTRAADLPGALPAWSRTRDLPLFRDTAIWVAAVAVAFALVRQAERRGLLRQRAALMTALCAALALASMGAVSTVWRVHGASGVSTVPAQLDLLRRIARGGDHLVLDMGTRRLVAPANVPGRLRLELSRPLTVGRGGGSTVGTMFTIPAMPAGAYRLTAVSDRGGGRVMIGIGADQFSLRTDPLTSPPQPQELAFPVDVRGIIVRGDEEARQALSGLLIEPLALVQPSARLTNEYARRAVRYGGATVYFLDDRSFPEPEAFWIGGSRASDVVIQPDTPSSAVSLTLRNAPVQNRIVLQSAGWSQELRMAPGEERQMEVPVAADAGAALIRVSAVTGFRPSEVDANSRDHRFLGVWMKILEQSR